jgi:hypothetical protein
MLLFLFSNLFMLSKIPIYSNYPFFFIFWYFCKLNDLISGFSSKFPPAWYPFFDYPHSSLSRIYSSVKIVWTFFLLISFLFRIYYTFLRFIIQFNLRNINVFKLFIIFLIYWLFFKNSFYSNSVCWLYISIWLFHLL